jgi:hypothetical protein
MERFAAETQVWGQFRGPREKSVVWTGRELIFAAFSDREGVALEIQTYDGGWARSEFAEAPFAVRRCRSAIAVGEGDAGVVSVVCTGQNDAAARVLTRAGNGGWLARAFSAPSASVRLLEHQRVIYAASPARIWPVERPDASVALQVELAGGIVGAVDNMVVGRLDGGTLAIATIGRPDVTGVPGQPPFEPEAVVPFAFEMPAFLLGFEALEDAGFRAATVFPPSMAVGPSMPLLPNVKPPRQDDLVQFVVERQPFLAMLLRVPSQEQAGQANETRLFLGFCGGPGCAQFKLVGTDFVVEGLNTALVASATELLVVLRDRVYRLNLASVVEADRTGCRVLQP